MQCWDISLLFGVGVSHFAAGLTHEGMGVFSEMCLGGLCALGHIVYATMQLSLKVRGQGSRCKQVMDVFHSLRHVIFCSPLAMLFPSA